jgi:hypothetical protein
LTTALRDPEFLPGLRAVNLKGNKIVTAGFGERVRESLGVRMEKMGGGVCLMDVVVDG